MLVILPGVMDVSLAQTSRARVFESEHIRILRKYDMIERENDGERDQNR